jgi:hypothetical protein
MVKVYTIRVHTYWIKGLRQMRYRQTIDANIIQSPTECQA